MATSVEHLTQVEKLVNSIAGHIESMHKQSQGLDGDWGHLLTLSKSIHGHLDGSALSFLKIGKRMMANLESSISIMQKGIKDIAPLHSQFAMLEKELEDVSEAYKRNAATIHEVNAVKESLAKTKQQIDLAMSDQNAFLRLKGMSGYISTTASKWKNIRDLIVAVVGSRLVKDASEFHRVTVAANKALADREGFYRRALDVQAKIGASSEELNESAAELVGYGMEYEGDLKNTLTTVLKMKAALSLSVKSGAELAFIFHDRLKNNFQAVGDAVANTVKRTALSSEEAASYMIKVGRGVMMMQDEFSSLSTDIAETVAGLEGAVKRLGGTPGEISDFISGAFNNVEGSLKAAMLGLSPEKLVTKEGSILATKRLAEYVTMIEKSSKGNHIAYLAGLEALESQFGISSRTLRQLPKVMEQYNKDLKSTTTLDKEWNTQLSLTHDAFSRLMHASGALVKSGLTPLLYGLNRLAGFTASIIEKLNKIPGIGTLGAIATVAIGLQAFTKSASFLWTALVKPFSTGALFGGVAKVGRALLGLRTAGTVLGATAAAGETAIATAGGGATVSGLAALGPAAIVMIVAAVIAALVYFGIPRLWQIFHPKSLPVASPYEVAGYHDIQNFRAAYHKILDRKDNGELKTLELETLANSFRDAVLHGKLGSSADAFAKGFKIADEASEAAFSVADISSARAQLSNINKSDLGFNAQRDLIIVDALKKIHAELVTSNEMLVDKKRKQEAAEEAKKVKEQQDRLDESARWNTQMLINDK